MADESELETEDIASADADVSPELAAYIKRVSDLNGRIAIMAEQATVLESGISKLQDVLSQLRAAGDKLAAVLKSGSDRGSDDAVDAWENLVKEVSGE